MQFEAKNPSGARRGLPAKTEALVFDLDGTLADTECLYRRFWVEAARMLGYPMEDRHALMIRSMGAQYAAELLAREVCPDFDYMAVRTLRRKIMGEYLEAHGVQAKRGAAEVLEAAKKKGLKIALATATPTERARRVLSMMGVESCFDALACGDRVEHGKPEPDLYRLALSEIGVPAERAVGVEDSPSGVKSARAAGLFTVLIPDQDQPDDTVRPYCDLILSDLTELAALVSEI